MVDAWLNWRLAGAFVSLDHDGRLYVERGFVRPEDELPADAEDRIDGGEASVRVSQGSEQPDGPIQGAMVTTGADAGENEEEVIRPLPDRLIAAIGGPATHAAATGARSETPADGGRTDGEPS